MANIIMKMRCIIAAKIVFIGGKMMNLFSEMVQSFTTNLIGIMT